MKFFILVLSLGFVLYAFFFGGSWPWNWVGAALLLGLWLWALFQYPREPRAFRLLPGHALVLALLGRTGTLLGLCFWLAAVALTYVLMSDAPRVRPLWAILWPVSIAAFHQALAMYFYLSGTAFWAWTASLALAGLALTVKEVRTILRAKG